MAPIIQIALQRALASADAQHLGKFSRLQPAVHLDLLPAEIEEAHFALIPSRPNFLANIFGRHGVISFGHFHIAVSMHRARSFPEQWEQRRWQRQQMLFSSSKSWATWRRVVP